MARPVFRRRTAGVLFENHTEILGIVVADLFCDLVNA